MLQSGLKMQEMPFPKHIVQKFSAGAWPRTPPKKLQKCDIIFYWHTKIPRSAPGCCNIAIISSFPDNIFYHVWTMAVDLSWWFQQRCSSLLTLFIHQAMSSQQRCSSWPAQLVQACQQAKTSCAFLSRVGSMKCFLMLNMPNLFNAMYKNIRYICLVIVFSDSLFTLSVLKNVRWSVYV